MEADNNNKKRSSGPDVVGLEKPLYFFIFIIFLMTLQEEIVMFEDHWDTLRQAIDDLELDLESIKHEVASLRT